MRRIFPLKSVSPASSNHNGQHSGGGALASAAPQKESPRLKAVGTTSRQGPELSKKSTSARSRRMDASTSDDVKSRGVSGAKREHWCPTCPATENGVTCDTPPSGDENIEGKEVEKAVIVDASKHPSGVATHRQNSLEDGCTVRDKQALDPDESLQSVLAEAMRGSDCCAPSVDKYPSKRSGLGAVENQMQGRATNKLATKSKGTAGVASLPPAPAAQDETPRSTSAPKVRATSRGAQPDCLRVHSMRITRVPDRVFDGATGTPSHSSGSPRVSDLSSSGTDSFTPRAASGTSLRASAAAYERQRQTHLLTPVKTHSRAQSFSEGSNGGRPPLGSPSFSRKPQVDSPRTPTSGNGTAPISAVVGAESFPAHGDVEKGPTTAAFHSSNKYSGARVVAERLAKAFRSTSKAKDGKQSLADGERKTTLGQSKRMSSSTEQHRHPQQQLSDASYDGSCSDSSSILASDEKMSLLNVLPMVRPAGDVHSHRSRSDHPVVVGASGEDEHVLTWQEFVSGANATSQRQSSMEGNAIPEKRADPSPLGKTTGPVSGSRRWAGSAQDEPKNSDVGRSQHPSSQQEEKEREILKAWLEGLKRQSEGMNDDLEMKARIAEQRLSMLNGEQSLYDDQLDFLHELQMKDDNGKSSLATGINIMQQRIRRMHEEKKRLALEVAHEVKRRITERAAAKEVLVMMKREMEACVRVMEKEKMGIQLGLERELERREKEWSSKIEDIKMEDNWLRERVRRLEEEKGGLQSELAAVESTQSALRDKVKDFENQMDGHTKRVEGAENTIRDLRQSLVSSCQQARQAECDLDVLKKACAEKDSQNQDFAKQVERLQQLHKNHDCSIEGLQHGLRNGAKASLESNGKTSESVKKELVRLGVIEKSLRQELETAKSQVSSLQGQNKSMAEKLENGREDEGGFLRQNMQTELSSLRLRIAELQEENHVLAYDLQQAVGERNRATEVVKILETKLSGIEESTAVLQDEVGRERNKIQEKERDIHRLERRVDGLLKNNQMLQGILAMREKAALISDEDAKEKERAVKEAYQLEAEMRESLQVSARQLSFMSDRAELMNEKLEERDSQLAAVKADCGKKDETIRNLEQNLGDLTKSVDTQNRRIMHLTSRNGELSRHLQAKGKEIEDLRSKMLEDSQRRIHCNQEMDQISVQASDIKQELEAQDLLCKLLRDKLSQKEDELAKRCEEITNLVRNRDWLQAELKRAQTSLGDASQRLAALERTVRQKEESMSSLIAEKDGHLRDLCKLRELLPRVEHERDEIHEEAEEIGREALRMSAEVEVLRRKVAQLEEDVMVKEGQISILRGSCFGGNE